jgi:hypothetical protein
LGTTGHGAYGTTPTEGEGSYGVYLEKPSTL